jgi:hypothetical protein
LALFAVFCFGVWPKINSLLFALTCSEGPDFSDCVLKVELTVFAGMEWDNSSFGWYVSGARDSPFVRLVIVLISHPDFAASLQWVVFNVTLCWSSVGVLSNVQFSGRVLFRPLSGSILITSSHSSMISVKGRSLLPTGLF